MEIIKCLEKSRVVNEFNILDFKLLNNGFYVRIKAVLVDSTELYIREYVDANERNYSYHWQLSTSELIIRWDNAPHHKLLKTHPHHLHQQGQISETEDISCVEILKVIEHKLSQ